VEDACAPCPIGQFCPIGGVADPEPCPKGTYNDATGGTIQTSSCKNCGYNKYNDIKGATSASQCKSCGTNANGEELTTSTESATGAQSCQAKEEFMCPPLQPPTNSTAGGVSVQYGKAQRPSSSNQECEDCPQGYHGDDGRGQLCQLCPAGYFQDQPAQQECKTCSSALCKLAPGATSDSATMPDGLKLRLPKSGDDSASDFGDSSGSSSDRDSNTLQESSNDQMFSDFASQTGVQPDRLVVYILCALFGLLIILFHRKCPDKIKVLDMFSEKHVVEDSHALRNLETKMGAGFTLALVFVVGAIITFISDPINNFIKSSGLEPGTLNLLPTVTSSYQSVTIIATMFAARTDATCTGIEYSIIGGGLEVADETRTETSFDGVGIECSFSFNCIVSSTIRGTNDFVVTMPEPFQWMEWQVESSVWSPDPPSRLGSILATNSTADGGQILSGTLEDPTTLTFGAIRSSHFDEFKKDTMYALQLFWRGTGKKLAMTTGSSRTHSVAFRFQVEENVYVSKLRAKLNFSSMLSVSERW
jgi:hypothetical protein